MQRSCVLKAPKKQKQSSEHNANPQRKPKYPQIRYLPLLPISCRLHQEDNATVGKASPRWATFGGGGELLIVKHCRLATPARAHASAARGITSPQKQTCMVDSRFSTAFCLIQNSSLLRGKQITVSAQV